MPAERPWPVDAPRPPGYCRPGSKGCVSLKYRCPPSWYARYTKPVAGLYDGAWKFVAPPIVGATTLPSALDCDPAVTIGRPFESKPLLHVCVTKGVAARNLPLVRSST